MKQTIHAVLRDLLTRNLVNVEVVIDSGDVSVERRESLVTQIRHRFMLQEFTGFDIEHIRTSEPIEPTQEVL